jgi:hypothetical protein
MGTTYTRGGKSASFFNIFVSPPTFPGGDGDLYEEKFPDGRMRGNDLGTELTGCDGGIDKPLRENVIFANLSLLSPARPNEVMRELN